MNVDSAPATKVSPQAAARPSADLAEAAARVRLGDVARSCTTCFEGTTLDEVRALFAVLNLRCLPVVDAEHRLVGCISRSDLVFAPPTGAARDIMPATVHALPREVPLGYAMALMAIEQISAVPVVSDEGELVGVVTALDALKWTAELLGWVVPR